MVTDHEYYVNELQSSNISNQNKTLHTVYVMVADSLKKGGMT